MNQFEIIVIMFLGIGTASYLFWQCYVLKWRKLAQSFNAPFPEDGEEDPQATVGFSVCAIPMIFRFCMLVRIKNNFVAFRPVWYLKKWPSMVIPKEAIKSYRFKGSGLPTGEIRFKDSSTVIYIHGDAAELVHLWYTRCDVGPSL